MNNLKIAGDNLPDMPWEDRPAGSKEVLWRYTQNPIIGRDALSTSNSVFNSAVVPFKKGKYNYAGVFRCDDTNRRMRIHVGFSVDGLKWDIDEEDFRLTGGDAEIGQWVYGYDPRVAKIEDKYYVTWCNGYHGPTIGIAWTDDFATFHQLENAFIPFNRNGYVYAFGSALLDLDEPWKVAARSGPYLISPREQYECMGDVPNVTFPCAALHDPATGRVAVYYGCADTVTGLAFGYIPEIIEFTKKNNIL